MSFKQTVKRGHGPSAAGPSTSRRAIPTQAARMSVTPSKPPRISSSVWAEAHKARELKAIVKKKKKALRSAAAVACMHDYIVEDWPSLNEVHPPPGSRIDVPLDSVHLLNDLSKEIRFGTGVKVVFGPEGKEYYARVYDIIQTQEGVWVMLDWWYTFADFVALSPAQVPAAVVKSLKPTMFGTRELIHVLNHRQSVRLRTIVDTVKLYTWQDSDILSEVGESIDCDPSSMFARYQYCAKEKKFVMRPETDPQRLCPCKRPFVPDTKEEQIQHYCARCNRWSHRECRLGVERGHTCKEDVVPEYYEESRTGLAQDLEARVTELWPLPQHDGGGEALSKQDIPRELFALVEDPIIRGVPPCYVYGNMNVVLRARCYLRAALTERLRAEDLEDTQWKTYVYRDMDYEGLWNTPRVWDGVYHQDEGKRVELRCPTRKGRDACEAYI